VKFVWDRKDDPDECPIRRIRGKSIRSESWVRRKVAECFGLNTELFLATGRMSKLEALQFQDEERRRFSLEDLRAYGAEFGWQMKYVKRREYRNVKIQVWAEEIDGRGRRTVLPGGQAGIEDFEIEARTSSTTFVSAGIINRIVAWAKSEAEDGEKFDATCPI
jgi:hypothetical protein